LGERTKKLQTLLEEEERSTGYICVECKVRKRDLGVWHKLDPPWQGNMTVTKMGGGDHKRRSWLVRAPFKYF